MKSLGFVSAGNVAQSFCGDSKVVAVSAVWPATLLEQIAVIAKAQRPADAILSLVWQLWEMDSDELLAVRSVWVPTGCRNHSWTLRQMVDEVEAGRFDVPDPDKRTKVQERRKEFAAKPPTTASFGTLIGYRQPDGSINLEEGHTRVTAAALQKCLPAKVRMFVGEPPAAPPTP